MRTWPWHLQRSSLSSPIYEEKNFCTLSMISLSQFLFSQQRILQIWTWFENWFVTYYSWNSSFQSWGNVLVALNEGHQSFSQRFKCSCSLCSVPDKNILARFLIIEQLKAKSANFLYIFWKKTVSKISTNCENAFQGKSSTSCMLQKQIRL